MSILTTRIHVAKDDALSDVVPHGQIPPGEHEATIRVIPPPKRRLSVRNMLVRNIPWNEGVLLRRDDMYGDDGR